MTRLRAWRWPFSDLAPVPIPQDLRESYWPRRTQLRFSISVGDHPNMCCGNSYASATDAAGRARLRA